MIRRDPTVLNTETIFPTDLVYDRPTDNFPADPNPILGFQSTNIEDSISNQQNVPYFADLSVQVVQDSLDNACEHVASSRRIKGNKFSMLLIILLM